jgi:hypothetical protein
VARCLLNPPAATLGADLSWAGADGGAPAHSFAWPRRRVALGGETFSCGACSSYVSSGSRFAVIPLQTACVWSAPDPSAFLSSPAFAQSLASAIDDFEEATSFLLEEPSGPQENQSKHKLMPLHTIALLRGGQRKEEDHLQRARRVPVASLRRFVPRKLLPSTAQDDPPSFP